MEENNNKFIDKTFLRAYTIGFFLLIIIGMLSSCTVYKTPKMHITSVLAVTAEGDTLKLPIDVIRPIYNYNTYPSNRYPVIPNYFYYSPWRNYGHYEGNSIYRPNNNGSNINIPNMPSSSGSGANISSPAIVNPPSNPPNPAKSNSKRNN